MKIIILAAGKGIRLGSHTKEIPKCLIKLRDKPILEWQLDVIKKCGIDDIIVIRGYKSEEIKYENIRYYTNVDFETTNMLYTLFCAAEELNEEVIISYGDIIYSEKVLKSLIESKADISVVVDTKWREYWAKRAENPFDDAESLVLNDNNEIQEIGQKPATPQNTHAQYIGLTKFSKKGIEALKETYSDDNTWNTGRKFQNLYFTDLLQKLIRTGHTVSAVPTERNWFEFDTEEDLQVAEKEFNF